MAESPATRVVGVVDFRSPALRDEFQARFRSELDEALRGSGLAAVVHFESVDLAGQAFGAAVRRIESRRPDAYYATTTNIARQVRQINPTVPIVFSGIVDPRAVCLLRSIEQPENGMTGFVSYEDTDEKRLELLSDLSHSIRRIGVITFDDPPDCDFVPPRVPPMRRPGVEVLPLVVTARTPAAAVGDFIRRERIDALDAPTSVFVRENYPAIIEAARKARIPLSFRGAGFLRDGGVLAYEPREFDYPVKAARLVARILQGANPRDIPIEFPSEFILSINLSGVTALPYPVSKHVLRRANRLYP